MKKRLLILSPTLLFIYIICGIFLMTGCGTPTTQYTVKFYDANGEVVNTVKVAKDGFVTYDVEPKKAGYTFIGWDKDLSEITSNLEVYPLYEETLYKVVFYDANNQILSQQNLKYQETAVAPDTPSSVGYTFVKWSEDFSSITEDLDVYPVFEKTKYIVNFYDKDGEVNQTYEIEYLDSAKPTNLEEVSGYTFVDWDTDFENVASNLEVHPIYISSTPSSDFTDGLTFLLTNENDGYEVSGYSGDDKIVVIPSEYNNLPVVRIKDNAFINNKDIQVITLPNTIKEIGKSAFNNCVSLVMINLPNSINKIGEAAFAYCFRLKNIDLPDSITIVPNNLFSACRRLENVVFHNSITKIGDCAFQDCIKLKDILVPTNLKTIGSFAFSNCLEITEFILPKGFLSTSNYSFTACPKLLKVYIPSTVTKMGYCGLPANDNLVIICEVPEETTLTWGHWNPHAVEVTYIDPE